MCNWQNLYVPLVLFLKNKGWDRIKGNFENAVKSNAINFSKIYFHHLKLNYIKNLK